MGQNAYDSNRVHGFFRELNHGRNLGLAICLVRDECFEVCRIAQSHWWVRFSPILDGSSLQRASGTFATDVLFHHHDVRWSHLKGWVLAWSDVAVAQIAMVQAGSSCGTSIFFKGNFPGWWVWKRISQDDGFFQPLLCQFTWTVWRMMRMGRIL